MSELEFTTKISKEDGQKKNKEHGHMEDKDTTFKLTFTIGPGTNRSQLEKLQASIIKEIEKSGGQSHLD